MRGRDRRWIAAPLTLVVACGIVVHAAGTAAPEPDRAHGGFGPLSEPSAVAVGPDGSIYVCEALGHRVSVFGPDGTPLRTWGHFGRSEGAFDAPGGIAVSDDGLVYVADTGNDRIQVFTTDGRFKRQWGRHGTESGNFDEPRGLAVRGDRVFVADSRNNRVEVFGRDGAFQWFVWSYGYHDGAFDRPVDVAVDPDGNFYVSDQGNGRIQKFSPDGGFLLAFGGRGRRGGLLVDPSGLSERDGRIVVADRYTHRLVTFDLSGALLGEGSTGGGSNLGLDAPSSVAFVPEGGSLVVCSAVEGRCERASPERDLGPVAADAARLIARDGYTVGGSGKALVVGSRDTGVPWIVDLSGRAPSILVTLGGPGREPLEFMRPAGFDLDRKHETVLVSDAGNGRLQRLRLVRAPGDARGFDATRTRFVLGIGLDDQERLDVEPGHWPLDPATMEPGAIARDARRRLLVADTTGRRIVAFREDFSVASSWGGFGDEDGRFRSLAGLAVDPAGKVVYALDAGRRRVQAFDLDGHLVFAWGGPGDGPGEFLAPVGLATGRDGSIYVVDRGADRVLRFDRRGRSVGTWGRSGSGSGAFWRPEAVHVDGRGRVIVIDSGNRRAQAFTSAGRFLWEMPLDPAQLAPRDPSRAIGGTSAQPRPSRIVSNGGRYAVSFTTTPDPVPLNAPFAMNVAVYDGPGHLHLARNVILEADATMPEHHHGMNLKPSVRAIDGPPVQDLLPGHGAMGDGRFEVRGLLFHMPGRWEMHFDITHGAITERAQLDIDLD